MLPVASVQVQSTHNELDPRSTVLFMVSGETAVTGATDGELLGRELEGRGQELFRVRAIVF